MRRAVRSAAPLFRGVILGGLCGLCLLAIPSAARAQAQGLEGRVIRGLDGEGVSGVAVELHRVSETGGAIVDSSVTGPAGAFRFDFPGTEGRPLFLAAARYQGVRYFGPALHAGMTPDASYLVSVYDTVLVSSVPDDLTVGSRHVVVTASDDGMLEVAEVIDLRGAVDRTLVAVDDTLALWSTALPSGAQHVGLIEGGGGTGAIEFSGGRVWLRSMIAPIGVRLSYGYQVSGDQLRMEIEHPTERIDVVVAGFSADVQGASHTETTTRAGQLVHRYEAAGLGAGEVVLVRRLTSAPVDRWVWIWAAVGAGFLLAAGALWWSGGTSR